MTAGQERRLGDLAARLSLPQEAFSNSPGITLLLLCLNNFPYGKNPFLYAALMKGLDQGIGWTSDAGSQGLLEGKCSLDSFLAGRMWRKGFGSSVSSGDVFASLPA